MESCPQRSPPPVAGTSRRLTSGETLCVTGYRCPASPIGHVVVTPLDNPPDVPEALPHVPQHDRATGRCRDCGRTRARSRWRFHTAASAALPTVCPVGQLLSSTGKCIQKTVGSVTPSAPSTSGSGGGSQRRRRDHHPDRRSCPCPSPPAAVPVPASGSSGGSSGGSGGGITLPSLPGLPGGSGGTVARGGTGGVTGPTVPGQQGHHHRDQRRFLGPRLDARQPGARARRRRHAEPGLRLPADQRHPRLHLVLGRRRRHHPDVEQPRRDPVAAARQPAGVAARRGPGAAARRR